MVFVPAKNATPEAIIPMPNADLRHTELTSIIFHPFYLEHLRGYAHIERPERLEVILDMLNEPANNKYCRFVKPRTATKAELSWNHTIAHIERVERTAGCDAYEFDPDTTATACSWDAACLAAGGMLTAIDEVMSGVTRNAVVLARPPGHHAEKNRAMGFCLFNNVAIGAHYLLRQYAFSRVLIVDWDLHHGNGTQDSFYADNRVLYFSSHQSPCYPGTGQIHETGEAAGRGFTVNIPLPAGMADSDFAHVYHRILVPVAERFKPDFVLVSAGFDIHEDDPLGGMRVNEAGLACLSRLVMDIAREYCEGRCVFCLEGGYSLTGLQQGIKAILFECAGKGLLSRDEMNFLENEALIKDRTRTIIERVIDIHGL